MGKAGFRRIRQGVFLAAFLVLCVVPTGGARGEDIYVFQGADGTFHYATLSRIPPTYRKSARIYIKGGLAYASVRKRLPNGYSESSIVFSKKQLLRTAFASTKPVSVEFPYEARYGKVAREDRYDSIIAQASRAYGVNFSLLKSVIKAESNFNPLAVSPKGACGMMQLMPATAQELGVQDVFDPNENIHAGSRYLKWLLDVFEGDVQRALAAYNAGPNRVWLEGIPDIQETRVYLQRVGSFLREYADRAGPTVASK